MNIIWAILLGGIGTYLMRSTGIWVPSQYVQLHWLNYLPVAVILVMAVSSISNLTGTLPESVGALAASLAVILANLKNLPLVVCIAIGCVVFGLLSGLA